METDYQLRKLTARKIRYDDTVEKLKEIRTAQIMYKRKYEQYMGDLDTLKQFIMNDSVMILRQIGDPNDSTVVVQKVETWVPVIDSLYKANNCLLYTSPSPRDS